jgi:hypothetical protein
MIKQPAQLVQESKRMRILIAGFPGIGKSTLGLSAPRPLHIDTDFGADRVEARYRAPLIQPQSYDELLQDLVPANLGDFETLVFDTGGQLLELMKPWAIRKDPKNGKKDGLLGLQGYGAVSKEFKRLMDHCYYTLKKHIVVLFHAKEDKDGDNTKLRLLVEGSTKDNVWQPMDLGGFMEISGNDRIIGFSPCERHFAKGTHGISGAWTVPPLSPGARNDFLSKLFAEVDSNLKKEAEAYEELQAEYETAIATAAAAEKDYRKASRIFGRNCQRLSCRRG